MTEGCVKDTAPRRSGTRLPTWILIALACVAFVAKLTIAHNTYGTNDAITFERDIAKIESDGAERLYREGVETMADSPRSPFSHSPAVIHLLRALRWMELRSGQPVRFWIRFLCSIADLFSLLLMWKIGIRSIPRLLVIALSPILLMISGFHVNTDPIVIALVLLSVWLAITGRTELAGLTMGGALAVKMVAVVFVPVLVKKLGWPRSIIYLACAGGCFVALSLPFLVQFPGLILHSMATYSGQMGLWGIPALFLLFGSNNSSAIYESIGKYIALSAVLVAVFTMRRPTASLGFLAQLGFAFGLFLVFTPGFGAQYLVYLVPWLCLAHLSTAIAFYSVGAAYMFAKYTFGSGGFPWYLCNLFGFHRVPRLEFFLEMATWIAVVVVSADLFRRSPERDSENHRSIGGAD